MTKQRLLGYVIVSEDHPSSDDGLHTEDCGGGLHTLAQARKCVEVRGYTPRRKVIASVTALETVEVPAWEPSPKPDPAVA